MLIEQNQQPALGNSPARLDSAAGTQPHPRLRLALFLVVGVYAAFYLMGFLASPVGRFPLLDGAENMELARQIATGTLPSGPFYRAMLYPGVLSLFLRAGISMEWLPVAAGLVGLGCHLGSTFCVYRIARRAWATPSGGLVAAALFGLNPVAVYFAAEPLDTTLALFLFLAGLDVLHAWVNRAARFLLIGAVFDLVLPIALGTAFWSLAMLARPHYAVVLVGLPIVFLALFWRHGARLLPCLAAYVAVATLVLGSAGLLEQHIGGKFRVMPTQGAFSLWVGNRSGANGRYYEQKLHLAASDGAETENPARIESELLYRRETGDTGPLDMDRMNAYWKGKTLTEIRAHPLAWLELMTRKAYYLFNNFEQYNNKTFAIQKQLSLLLRWNPLGWGLTLILCATGLVGARTFLSASVVSERGPGSSSDQLALIVPADGKAAVPRDFWFLAAIATLYGLGVILFFISDRFRLPLLPFLCIGAGAWGQISFCRTLPTLGPHDSSRASEPEPRSFAGTTTIPVTKPALSERHSIQNQESKIKNRFVPTILLVALASSLLSFSRFWGVYDLSPAIQDYVLLSIAAGKAGDDWQALRWARVALVQRPNHPDALACAVTSFYNLELRGAMPEKEFADETWQAQERRVAAIPEPAKSVRLVQAIASWKLGQLDQARVALQALERVAENEVANQRARDDALGVLLLAGLGDREDQLQAEQRVQQTKSFYLLVAVIRRETEGRRLVPEAQRFAATQADPVVSHVFPR